MFGFEIKILKLLEGLRSDFLIKLFELITMLGEETVIIILSVTLWFAFDKKIAQRLFFITASSLAVNSIIKNFTKISRPWTTGQVTCVRPDTATGYSFPSGHTQNFTTWTTVVALKIKKWWISLTVSVLIALVAFSRLFLGAHYPSDVVVAVLLGVGIAFIGNYLYDSVENKSKLCLGMVAIMTPFVIFFMFGADPLFKDLYKIYGMMCGLGVAIAFEEKFVSLEYNVAWWKKLARVVVGVVVAYALKEGIKALDIFDITRITFVIDAIRYFVLVFVVGGICPWIFKKCNI